VNESRREEEEDGRGVREREDRHAWEELRQRMELWERERERHTGRNIAYLDFGIPTVGFFTLVP
jgi:hypothetical protein